MAKIVISPSQQTGIEENLVRPIAETLFNGLIADGLVEPVLVPDYSGMSDEAALWNTIQFSNEQNPDYHLEIHADAGGYATGCSGLYVSEGGKNFIAPITQAIMDLTPWDDVGIRKRTDLGALNKTTAVAGLIELSFYDNPTELAWIQDNVDLIANTIKMGIYKALGIAAIDWEQRYKDLVNQYYNMRTELVDITNRYV